MKHDCPSKLVPTRPSLASQHSAGLPPLTKQPSPLGSIVRAGVGGGGGGGELQVATRPLASMYVIGSHAPVETTTKHGSRLYVPERPSLEAQQACGSAPR